MSLTDKLKVAAPAQARRGPLWRGPEEDGVTFSLLSRFLVCRERFRLLAVEGLRPRDQFNHRIEYGNMWHVCEEIHAGVQQRGHNAGDWRLALLDYSRGLASRYRTQAEQVDHWYNVCKTQFPLYVDYWSKHLDVSDRTPLLQEQVFDVPYKLPGGRTVRLRGKWDSVDLIGSANPQYQGNDRVGPKAGVYLQENKTKGDIHEEQLQRQLTFDLQTMLYLVALIEMESTEESLFPPGSVGRKSPILGVRYNVVRRPLSGGKGSIVRHKATGKKPEETKEHYYGRLADIIKEDPGHFFMRWKVEVTAGDVARFRRECLDPILEQLCEWWDWISTGVERGYDPFSGPMDNPLHHWRHPFGVYNVLDEGGSSDLDEYLASGSETGLARADNLFPELEGG